MKKSGLFLVIFTFVIALSFYSCSFFKKEPPKNNDVSGTERLSDVCIISNNQAIFFRHWVLMTRQSGVYTDGPVLVADSFSIKNFAIAQTLHLMDSQIDFSDENAIYVMQEKTKAPRKLGAVYISRGEGQVTRYGIIDGKMSVKKFSKDDFLDFPEKTRNVLIDAGIYVVNNL
jgi:hypothetical protein